MANDDTRAAPLLCAHALDLAGALPDPATIAGCPICWRRWRLAEARLCGWLPLDAATARPLLDRMAAEAAAGVDTDQALSERFYAFLAGSSDDEADFAAACVVAFAPRHAEPPRRPPADFGWRAIFADLPASSPDPAPPAPAATFTRVWQWREIAASGTMPRRETRTFMRGESPPPFAPLSGDSAGRWVRERAAYETAESSPAPQQTRQIVGPLALLLTEVGSSAASLTLRLRDGAGTEAVAVRLYADAGPDAGAPLWRGTLSPVREETTISLGPVVSRGFTLEFDTAW